jgi:hypothetical protein
LGSAFWLGTRCTVVIGTRRLREAGIAPWPADRRRQHLNQSALQPHQHSPIARITAPGGHRIHPVLAIPATKLLEPAVPVQAVHEFGYLVGLRRGPRQRGGVRRHDNMQLAGRRRIAVMEFAGPEFGPACRRARRQIAVAWSDRTQYVTRPAGAFPIRMPPASSIEIAVAPLASRYASAAFVSGDLGAGLATARTSTTSSSIAAISRKR